ncbi:MAG: HIT family protein [Gammaproteobacteria bacterium]|jgi:ATP adenylyltransferase|nr:HIT family protein [Gammaproteobacteria bacterium]MBT4462341.1 HIT family protein [Gammaproteobacteria bacterium]MBT4655268.1 HIT family protein [Gammaproteobacteria bacterium]MBT5117193.1 HIT family protein [Gammaproteobacteria bacterium]MBT5762083.1 HIT family protein [Gammaproteobacteria bacterium]
MSECLFCKIQKKGYEDEIVYENKFFIATRDSYPVTELHTLIIPKRHFASFFDMNLDEQSSLHQILKQQRDEILTIDPTVEAFNLGTNDGIAAGQSIFHLHIHLFPRRAGDIENPRGGVRGVIPAKQKYTKK